jgi:hypothetical protein
MVDSFAAGFDIFFQPMGIRLVLDPRRRGPCSRIDLTEVPAPDRHTGGVCLAREEVLG